MPDDSLYDDVHSKILLGVHPAGHLVDGQWCHVRLSKATKLQVVFSFVPKNTRAVDREFANLNHGLVVQLQHFSSYQGSQRSHFFVGKT